MMTVRCLFPDGWETSLRALGVLTNTREASAADLHLGITIPKPFLLGLPKQVGPTDVGTVPGACVLLVENGRPLQFALLASIARERVVLQFRGRLVLPVAVELEAESSQRHRGRRVG